MENSLILTIGLPYSGKSTWSLNNIDRPIVNPDSIRLAMHGQRYEQRAEDLVWAMAKIMVKSLFLAGHRSVIVDATHNTEKRRDFWKDPDWNRKYIVMDVNAEVCINRALAVNDRVIVPVIERMAAEKEFGGVYYGAIDSGDANDLMLEHLVGGKDQTYHEGSAHDGRKEYTDRATA